MEMFPKYKKNEQLMVTLGTVSCQATVIATRKKEVENQDQKKKKSKNLIKLKLSKPCCFDIGENISLSRKINSGFRLIGCGFVSGGVAMELNTSYCTLPSSSN